MGTRPPIIMLANCEMATPVLGVRRKGDVEVPRHERLRVQHPLPHKENPLRGYPEIGLGKTPDLLD